MVKPEVLDNRGFRPYNVDRAEGAQIAFDAGQTDELKNRLFSEDLY